MWSESKQCSGKYDQGPAGTFWGTVYVNHNVDVLSSSSVLKKVFTLKSVEGQHEVAIEPAQTQFRKILWTESGILSYLACTRRQQKHSALKMRNACPSWCENHRV